MPASGGARLEVRRSCRFGTPELDSARALVEKLAREATKRSRGSGARDGGQVGACGDEERCRPAELAPTGDRARGRAREREKEREKRSAALLTPRRSSRDARAARRGVGAAARWSDELRRARAQRRLGLGYHGTAAAADEAGQGRRSGTYIGGVGDPWLASQGGGATRVCRPDSTESRSATGGGRPRQAGPSCRWLREEKVGTGWAGEWKK